MGSLVVRDLCETTTSPIWKACVMEISFGILLEGSFVESGLEVLQCQREVENIRV